MVPIPEASYFPDLGKCLKGDEILISWETAFFALSDTFENGTQSTIEKFFCDPKVRHLFAKPGDAFPRPSAQTKDEFEQKLQPINTNSHQDSNTVKEDALWLSQEVDLDQVSALRVVVEEYQSRAHAQLLGGFSEEEIISLQDAGGRLNSASVVPEAAPVESTPSEAEERDTRRLRMLSIYLSDRRFFWKCLTIIYQRCQLAVANPDTWYQTLPGEVVGQWNNLGNSTLRVAQLIRDARLILERLLQGRPSGWFAPEGEHEALEIEWSSNQIIEATHMMETIFLHIWSEDAPPICPSGPILEWFGFVSSMGFLDQLEMPHPTLQALVLPLQTITTIISSTILTTDSCLIQLGQTLEMRTTDFANAPDTPWIMNRAAITRINEILTAAASSVTATASPAILAWSVILKQIRARVQNRRDAQRRRNEGYEDDDAQGDERAVDGRAVVLAPDAYEEIFDDLMDSPEEDPIDHLARSAVNGSNVFDILANIAGGLGDTRAACFTPGLGSGMRMAILELMRACADIGYMAETLQVVLSALDGGQGYWDLVDTREVKNDTNPVQLFIADPVLFRTFWQAATWRYPFESSPFLKLNHALATLCTLEDGELKTIMSLLEVLPSFTYQLPPQYGYYETTQEEENSNRIRLTRDLPLFELRWPTTNNGLLIGGADNAQALALRAVGEDLQIPAGALGSIVVESEPKVAHLGHNYSGIRYFGKLLETFLITRDAVDATTGMAAEPETVSEIIGTFSVILLSIARSGESSVNVQEAANGFFGTASSALSRNRDITLVISDIFEQELQRQSNESSSDASLEVLCSCTQYLHALLYFSPGRVWPLIGRSGLLGIDRGGGKLSTITGNVEVISGNFDFLVSCTRLFEALIDDFAVNAIARKRKINTTPARFQAEEHNVRVPDQVLSKVLLSFTRYLTEVLESSCTWKFHNQDQQLQLTKTIMASFDLILSHSFGIQDAQQPNPDPEQNPGTDPPGSATSTGKIMGALLPSAAYIVESFLSKSSGPMRFQSILRALYSGFRTPTSTMFLNRLHLVTDDVKAALGFSRRLLRVSTMLEKTSHLETQLFAAAPLIARLYAVNDSYRNPVIKLFEALIVGASGNISEPPSLLGYLGAKTSKSFLRAVSELDKPLVRAANVGSIWHFLSMVMSSRQQWFANYVLTGKTPRDAMQKTTAIGARNPSSPKPLLITALDRLSQVGVIPDTEALMMLEFVALAQNFWPWTMYDLENSTSFITYLSNHVKTLNPNQVTGPENPPLKVCYRTRIAAYIAEILAMHLFHSRQTGKPSIAKDLMPKLDYYLNHATGAVKYNASLHGNLQQNFSARYTGCALQSFRKTDLEDRQFGDNYFYDLELLDKMLNSDGAWKGRKNDGYRFELARANQNLSLVDAQVALLQGWKILAIELSSNIAKDTEHQQTLVNAAIRCLSSNTSSQRSNEKFSELLPTRADFALVICQRLMELNPKIPRMKQLLQHVWETIRTLDASFEVALAAGDASYYRLLLKILFLALRVHVEGNDPEDASIEASKRVADTTGIIRIVIEILERVVAQGIRDLAVFVHESHEKSSPEDIALITGILQACLRISGIEFCHPQIVSIMANCGTPRVATTLFSWSDKIAINGDPIYGELSIIFLLELSSMPTMAEQLAIDGILGHISSAAITTYLRRSNVSPFAEGAGIQRCYNIWVRGFLPLLLNLLHSVGSSIASEVAIFLNQFPHLLAQSAAAFDAPETSRTTTKSKPKHISLSTCSEVHSLALIVYILNGFREQLQGIQDVPEVAWDLGAVGENIEWWLGSRIVLRERIVPMGEKDMEWRGRKLDPKKEGQLGCQDRLEEKCVLEMMGVRDVVTGGDP